VQREDALTCPTAARKSDLMPSAGSTWPGSMGRDRSARGKTSRAIRRRRERWPGRRRDDRALGKGDWNTNKGGVSYGER